MFEAIFSENQDFVAWNAHHWGAILFFVLFGFLLIRTGQSLDEKGQTRLGVGMAVVILCFNIYCLLLRSQHQLRFAPQNSLNFFIGKCSFDCYWHYSSHNNPVKRG